MKTCCYDDHLPYTLWCSCKDLAWSSRGPRFESRGWNSFLFFFLIRPITITLINFFFIFTVGGAWVWLFWVYVYTMGVISGQFIFLLSVLARLKKVKNKYRSAKQITY